MSNVRISRRRMVLAGLLAGGGVVTATTLAGCGSGSQRPAPPMPTPRSTVAPKFPPSRRKGPMYDAVKYGVRADGRTDDTEALKALLQRVSAAGGGVVLLPAHRNVLVRRVGLPSRVDLRGAGPDATLTKLGASQNWISCATGARNSAIQDLVIETPVLARASMIEIGQGSEAITLDGCAIRNISGRRSTGIRVRETSSALIHRCTLVGQTTGIEISLGPVGVSIISTKIIGWTQQAITVLGTPSAAARSLLISKNVIEPNVGNSAVRQPIQFNGSDVRLFQNVVVQKNIVHGRGTSYHDPRRPGTADLISLHQCAHFRVVQNTCIDGGEVGITIARQCSDGVVANNVVESTDSTGIVIGSEQSDYVTNIVVRNNRLSGSALNRVQLDRPDWTRSAIAVYKASDIIVDGNTIQDRDDTQKYGISVVMSKKVDIGVDNHLIGSFVRKVLRK